MKISIGSRIVEGPWGGGNLFVVNFKNFLIENGHEVIHDLCDKDIDIILLTDPRSRKESSSTFNHIDINRYKKYVNPQVTVIQRINECDERKDTDFINEFYLEASKCADHVIFVSEWLREIYLNIGIDEKKTSVIMSGADERVFNKKDLVNFDNKKIKFVTHHWSSHSNKGFDIYLKFDELLSNKKYENYQFTYIGNVPDEVSFENVHVLNPLSGLELAREIKNNNIYLTASRNEPSGNHHIEAAQCGLPILYLNSGGIPEYCEGFGVPFSDDFEVKLNEIVNNYELYKQNLNNYPFSSIAMCEEFFDRFKNVYVEKQNTNLKTKKTNFSFFIILFNRCQKLFSLFNIRQSLKNNIKKLYK